MDEYDEIIDKIAPPSQPRKANPLDGGHLPDLISFVQERGHQIGSTTGGTHNRGSLHYSGNAVDIHNSGQFTDQQVAELSQSASERGFKVRDERVRPLGQKVWGGPHVHVEYAGQNPYDQAVDKVSPPKQLSDDPYDDAIDRIAPAQQPAAAQPSTADQSILTDEQKRQAIDNGGTPVLPHAAVSLGEGAEMASPEEQMAAGVDAGTIQRNQREAGRPDRPILLPSDAPVSAAPVTPIAFDAAQRGDNLGAAGALNEVANAVVGGGPQLSGKDKLLADKYHVPDSLSRGTRRTARYPDEPTEDNMVSAALSSYGPEYAKLNEIYRGATGQNIAVFREGRPTMNPDGTFHFVPMKSQIDSLNLFAQALKDGATPEDAAARVDDFVRGTRGTEQAAVTQARTEAAPDIAALESERKQMGEMPAGVRAVGAPTQRFGAGIIKELGGLTSGFGIAPNKLSSYLNTRADVLHEGATEAPLNAQGQEIVRGLPEKTVSAIGDLGFTVAQLAMLKKTTGLSMGQIMAIEAGLKTSDRPVGERVPAIAKAFAMGRVLDVPMGRIMSAGVFGVPTAVEGAKTYANAEPDKRKGALEDAILNTAVQAGAGALMGHGAEGEAPARLDIENAPVSGVQGRGALDADAILAQREANVSPEGLTARQVVRDEPVHHSQLQPRTAEGQFDGPPITPPAPEAVSPAVSPSENGNPLNASVESEEMASRKRAGQPEGLANAEAPQSGESRQPQGDYKTGQSVTIPYTRNTEGAAQYAPGGRYNEVVPGRYMVERPEGYQSPDARWEQGEVSFRNPLVIETRSDDPSSADNWKNILKAKYGKTGKALSDALRQDGYDGIITHDKYGTGEIVDLSTSPSRTEGAATVAPQPVDYPNVPERPETIQAQLDARGFALIPEGTARPPRPEGYQAELKPEGIVYFDPKRISAETIRSTPTSELLGHVENKSPETTRAVVARNDAGNEVHASAVSPENEAAQVAETQRNFPDANVESGGPAVAQRVLDERLRGNVPPIEGVVNSAGASSASRSNLRDSAPFLEQTTRGVNVPSEQATRTAQAEIKSAPLESPLDRGNVNAEVFGNSAVADAFDKHGLGGLDVESQRTVMSRVIGALQNIEIRENVVKLIPVDVVNRLLSVQSPSDVTFHDPSVLSKESAVDLNHSVSLRSDVADSLVSAVARSVAEVGGSESAGNNTERLTAVGTGGSDSHDVSIPRTDSITSARITDEYEAQHGSAEAPDRLLKNARAAELFDKIEKGEANESETNEFRDLARRYGVPDGATDNAIKNAASEASAKVSPVGDGSEAGSTAVPGQEAGAGDRSEEHLTGARVDVTRAEREARGRDPVQQQAYVAVGDAYAAGRRAVEGGSVDPRQIAQDVARSPRPLTSTEVGALAYDRARLINGHADAMKELNAALDAKDSARIEDANLLRGQIEEALDTNDEALERGGREQSAAFNARKVLIREDYSLAKMVNKVKAARGGKDVTPELRAQLESLTSDLEKAQKELQQYRDDAINRAARDELAKIFREERFQTRKGARVETRQRLNSEFKGLSSAFGKRVETTLSANPLFDPELYKLLGQMARNRVLAGSTELSGLVDSLYTEVRQHLPEITKRDIAEAFSGYGIKSGLSKDELATKMRNLKSEQRDLLAMEDIQSGRAPERSGFQRDPASPESRERQRKIRELLREKGIEIERTVRSPEDQMRTALDSTKTRLRNRIDDLSALIEGRATRGKKTNVPLDAEAQALSAERDRLQSAWDEMQESAKVRPDPETRRIENALTTTNRSIEDIEAKLKSGNIDPKRRESDPWSIELGKQKQRQAELQAQLAAARKAARPEPSEGELAQRQIDIAERALQKSVDDYTRRINDGDFSRKAQASAAWSPKITELKGRQSALRDRYEAALKNSDAGAAQRVQREMVSVQRNIDEVQGRIDRGEVGPRANKKTVQDWTPELGKLKQRQSEVQAQLDSLRKAAKPALTPEEAALKRYRSYLDRREADLERQITQAELLGRPLEKVKQRYTLEPGDLKRQADVKRLKERLDRIVADENWKNRSNPEKILGLIPKIRRMILLSSTSTNFKLNSFALQRFAQTPIEEAIGLGYSKLPGLRQIASQAPRHGGHAFIDGEVAAIAKAYGLYAEFVTKGKNSELFRIARGQKSDIEAVFGGKGDFPPELTNFFGQIHSAFKVPVKAAEFERSMANRLAYKAKQGADIRDPAVIHATGLKAYEDASHAILMQDNLPSKMFRGAIRTAEQNGPVGKVVAGALRIVFPITRVSSNFLSEGIGEYGGVNAAGRTVQLAWRAMMGKAVSDLSPEQSDAIMRSYKKGSTALGLFGASVAIGFLKPGFVKFGGYFQPGKRKDGDPQFGGVQIGGLNVPPVLVHNPLFVPFQIGATMRAVADARQEGGKMSRGDALKEGATAAVKGVASEIPFYEEPARLAAGLEGRGGGIGRYAGEYAGGMVSPPDLQRRARIGDQSQPVGIAGQVAQQFGLKEIHATPRTPTGFTEGFKSKFPGPYGRSSIPENTRIEDKDRHDALVEGMRNGTVPTDDDLKSQGYSAAQITKMKGDAKLSSFQVAFSNAQPDKAIERFERMDERQRYQVRDQMAYKAQALITRADYLLNNAKAEDRAKRQAERDQLQRRLDTLGITPEAKPSNRRSTGGAFKPPRISGIPAMR